MKKIAIFAAVVALGTAAASAQNYLGMLPYVSDFWMSRMYTLGGQSASLGTTRSAAMGGAFTSLGADLSSMHINPAGLGMYKSSELGISFGPSISQMTTSMNGMTAQKSSRTAFALNNFGAAFNLFEGSGNLTSFTMGVGYQRLADYNYRSNLGFSGAKDADGNFDSSYLDMLKSQLEGYVGRIGYDNWYNGEVGADFGTNAQAARYNEWGASLAYYTKMLRPGAVDGEFLVNDVLGGNTRVTKDLSTVSKGSQGEFAFAGGWNLSNKFYFGFTLGIIDIFQDRTVTYREGYADNNSSDPLVGMTYEQRVRTSGSGFNAKMGFVWRPDPSLRIGAAFHTPTVMSVSDTYNSVMTAHFGNGDNWYETPEVEFKNRFYTPARVMAGISGTIAGRAIISADYEYTAADGMGVYSDIYDQNMIDTYRAAVKKYFTGSNTLRAGVEVMASDMLFLRAGYSWTGQGVRAEAHDVNAINAGKIEAFDTPTTYESNIASVGFGVKLGANASFDMTYSLGNYKYTDYDAYFYNQHNNPSVWGDGGPHYFGNSAGDMTRQRLTRHNIMLGLSFRF